MAAEALSKEEGYTVAYGTFSACETVPNSSTVRPASVKRYKSFLLFTRQRGIKKVATRSTATVACVPLIDLFTRLDACQIQSFKGLWDLLNLSRREIFL